jgi:stage II sporulation protein D
MSVYRQIIFLCLLTRSLIAQEEQVRVGLFRASEISSVQFEMGENTWVEIEPGVRIWGEKSAAKIQVQAKGNLLEIRTNSLVLGSTNKVRFHSNSGHALFLKPLKPDYKGNKYAGDIIVTASTGKLKFINQVNETDYLVGVLRGEVGYNKPLSLYQVHAILSRTYARYYQWRHKSEGFELCDQTHCQVYKGYFDYDPYRLAVLTTQNIVVKDSSTGNLAELLFHSNCGGFTNASEDVWKSTLSYCRSTEDTFCLASKNAFWSTRITLVKFCEKLALPYPNDSISKLEFCTSICSFEENRPQQIQLADKTFRMIDLRTRFDLKSAWFDWECRNDSVYFYGKGFGHGVGLCQEGAIRMAELGFSPDAILRHYFTGILITGTPLKPEEIEQTKF